MKRKVSLAYLTIPGVEAVDQIRIAAEAGYDFVSLRTIPMHQPGEPANELEKDPALFKKIQETLKAYNLKPLDIELVRVKEDLPKDYRGAFEKAAQLGATQVLCSVWTEDRNFAIDTLGSYCEQAKEFGLQMDLEFPAISGLRSLKDVIAVQDAIKAPNLKLLMDILYVYWDNETPELIKNTDPSRFGLIHMCDCPKDYLSYEKVVIMREKREHPGLGAAPIAQYLEAFPAELPCSIELPNKEYIEKYGALGHAKSCLKNLKKLF